MIINASPQQKNAIIALQGNSSFAAIKNMIQENLDSLRKQSDIIEKDQEIHVSRGQRQFAQGLLDKIKEVEEEHRRTM